ncbi:sulfatase-like hydrolase/transferase [Paenibacillus lautus]|uniref:LTA synthase family protein n=1 Tax=Paenibacillus lautus TaxID=1401 RepID=UPI00203BB294|nr:alkaline phosphatase family protein [Paenibacillus lautus]MCM3261600.1 sulfatase-like hydrolase/transferase [Paenibacillus lautus]
MATRKHTEIWIVIFASIIFINVFLIGRFIISSAKGIDVNLVGCILDVVYSVLILFLLFFTSRLFWLLPYIMIIPLAILHLANMEFIYAMNSTINLADINFITDGQFLNGTFSHISFPIYNLIFFICIIFIVVVFNRCSLTFSGKKSLIIILCCLLSNLVLSYFYSGDDWDEGNFSLSTINNSLIAIKKKFHSEGDPSKALAYLNQIETTRKVDEGQSLFINSNKPKNILLVIMEGIPGAYLGETLNYFDIEDKNLVKLSSFESIKEHTLIVPNFMTHNNQTIRGLYSIFSGDYPKLNSSTPKAYEYLQSDRNKIVMLPNELKKQGYNTAFIQAAPLEFMSKDRFMTAIGFDTVIGSKGFDKQYVPFGWGADDRTFLEQSMNYIEEINDKGKPWMVSLLTVGTHHPYAVPEEYVQKYGDRKDAAVAYLDVSIQKFIEDFNESGLADDTLVIFMSDESHGVNNQPYGLNWGFCLVYSNDIKSQIINTGVYGHKDVLNSVLDYVDPESSSDRIGKSIFRDYTGEDAILFSTNYGDIYYSNKKGEVYYLNKTDELYKISSNNGEMFANNYNKYQHNDDAIKNFLIYLRDYKEPTTDFNTMTIIDDQVIELIDNETVVVTDGQFLTIPENKDVTIRFDYEVLDSSEGDYIVLTLEDSENTGLTNTKIIDHRTSSGSLQYTFFNKDEKDKYVFMIKAKGKFVNEKVMKLRIKNLTIDYKSKRNSGISTFDIYNIKSLFKAPNLIPFFYTMNNSYLVSENHIKVKDNSTDNYLIYGPYIFYPSGKYTLRIEVKFDDFPDANKELFLVDIASNSGTRIYNKMSFRIEDMSKDNDTYIVELDFDLPNQVNDLEIRLKGLQKLNMTIQNISTIKKG